MSQSGNGLVEQSINRSLKEYKGQIEGWRAEGEALVEDYWWWEDLVAKANFVFARILALDDHIQSLIFSNKLEFDQQRDDQLRAVLRDWLEIAPSIGEHVDRLEEMYQVFAGADEFRAKFKQAKAILTPDNEYFNDEKLFKLGDQAVEAYRAANVEFFDVETFSE